MGFFSPTGASAALPCQFEVTRRWYSQQPGGERRFHFQLRDSGAVTCAATVLLSTQPSTYDWTIAPLAPGASGNYRWVEQVSPTVLTATHLLGLSPWGAQLTDPCQMEITRSWYVQRIDPDGTAQRQLVLTVTNVGAIGCTATVFLTPLTT